MLLSIVKYHKFLLRLKAQTKTESLFSNWIYAACFIMMSFFLVGYIASIVDFLVVHEVGVSHLLIATIFFFGAMFVFSMVTMIQRMFLTIAEQSDQLYIARDLAEQSNKAKTFFLTNISHEIRTPLNAIIGMNELIVQEDIPPKAVEYALHAKQAGINMLSLVNELLDFSKIEAGKMTIEHSEYSLVSLVNDAISLSYMRAHEKGLLFTVNVDSNIPRLLIGDQQRIREILVNLLSNAVKYTLEGYVSLDIRHVVTDDGIILIADITDSGVGIKAENMEYLFGIFYREETPNTKIIEGTGLGLAITKKLCTGMGGSVEVRSEYGVGSTFTVTLPQQVGNYETLADVESPWQKSVLLYEPRMVYAKSLAGTIENLGVRCDLAVSSPEFYEKVEQGDFQYIFISSFLYKTDSRLEELKQKHNLALITEFDESVSEEDAITFSMPVYSTTIANILNGTTDSMASIYASADKNKISFKAPSAKILIVDDYETNLTVVEGLISKYKIKTTTCRSGMDAIEHVKKARYDMILMDHAMPVMDGIEATTAIRALEDESGYFKRVPIVALTANAVSGMREIYLQNQMNDFLAKPIEMKKLDEILKKWIPRRKQELPDADNVKKSTKKEKRDNKKLQIQIEGIDVQLGLLYCGGEMEYYLKTLKVFYEDAMEKPKQIKEFLENNDIKSFTVAVHGLKSSAMSIGARGVSDFAKDLENAGRSEAIYYIMENYGIFLEQLEKLLVNIHGFVSTLEEEKPELDATELEYLKESLAGLKMALENMNAGSIYSIIEDLENGAWDKKHSDKINKLSQHILQFDFDGAKTLLDGLY